MQVSVVIPLLDEVENIRALHAELRRVLDGVAGTSEILLVDDGSRDGTRERLHEVAQQDPSVRVLLLTRNFGQTAAMQAGFDHARGDVVVTMDGDLQNDPSDIPRLLAEIEAGYDVVTGWRRERKDRWLSRRVPSVVANWMLAWLTGVRIHDHGCALKAYRREVTARTVLYSDMHRFVVAVASLSRGRCREIVVNHRPRRAGRSKYGLGRIWKSLLDMLVLVTLIRFTSRPASWFLLLGLPFVAAGAAFVMAVGLSWSSTGADTGARIVLAGSAILCAFGAGHFLLLAVLGELVMASGDYRESESVLLSVTETGHA